MSAEPPANGQSPANEFRMACKLRLTAANHRFLSIAISCINAFAFHGTASHCHEKYAAFWNKHFEIAGNVSPAMSVGRNDETVAFSAQIGVSVTETKPRVQVELGLLGFCCW